MAATGSERDDRRLVLIDGAGLRRWERRSADSLSSIREGLYIIEGHCTFNVGSETIEAGPGTFAFVPKLTEHSFSVDEPSSRLLNFYTPGGFELVVMSVAQPAAERKPPASGFHSHAAAVDGGRNVARVRPDPRTWVTVCGSADGRQYCVQTKSFKPDQTIWRGVGKGARVLVSGQLIYHSGFGGADWRVVFAVRTAVPEGIRSSSSHA